MHPRSGTFCDSNDGDIHCVLQIGTPCSGETHDMDGFAGLHTMVSRQAQDDHALGTATARPDFAEPWSARVRRWGLGMARALQPKRIADAPGLAVATLRFLVTPGEAWRPFETPTAYGPDGLVGISNDLSVDTLLRAYRNGVYPLCHVWPVKWWSPAERAVLDPAEIHISRNMRRLLRQKKFHVTFDEDFAEVMRQCAMPRSGKAPLTWITPRIMRAYWDLHQAGHAHSVEVRDEAGQLVGGLYGVAIGGVFFGESQFSSVNHASKIANYVLIRHLHEWSFGLRDGKRPTPHLASLGFQSVDRGIFQSMLQRNIAKPGHVGRWTVDETLDVADWHPAKEETGKTA